MRLLLILFIRGSLLQYCAHAKLYFQPIFSLVLRNWFCNAALNKTRLIPHLLNELNDFHNLWDFAIRLNEGENIFHHVSY